MFFNNLEMLKAMPYVLSAKAHVMETRILATLTEEDISGLFDGLGAAEEGGSLGEAMGMTKELGSGTVSLVQTAAIFIAVIMFLGGAIMMLMHSGNAQRRAEDKDAMGWKVLAIVLIGGGISVITVLFGFGEGLFNR